MRSIIFLMPVPELTALGFKISSSPADAEHPFGHGRTEYAAGLSVAILVLVLGFIFLKDSIFSVFSRDDMSADTVSIVILSSTILIKCWLFCFYRYVGKLIQSDVIHAAAYDSLSDCLGTSLVVAALITSRYTDFPVDGCAGILVALMILWAGGGVLKDTVSKLLGEPPDSELVAKLKKTILDCPGIDGIHDIMIHNCGSNSYYATAHAEISCDGDSFSAHDILENAEIMAGMCMPVHLLLHGDPYSKNSPEVIFWRSRMENAVAALDAEFKLYDFRVNKNEANEVDKISFHLLIPHNYRMSESEITDALYDLMKVHCQNIIFDIIYLKSFI